MSDVSKFIPIDGGEDTQEPTNNTENNNDNNFKIVKKNDSNLPVKSTFWTRFKSICSYQIRVELTPHQQKIEDEINEFFHKEITWKGFTDFLFGRSKSTPQAK